MSKTFDRRKAGLNAVAYSYFIQAILTAPRSKAEIGEISGMGPELVSRCLKALRDRGLLYVAGWRLDARGRMTLREYRFGKGEDAPCPKMDRKEVVARYKERKKSIRNRLERKK